MSTKWLIAALVGGLMAGCRDESEPDQVDGGNTDSGVDSGTDAGTDAGPVGDGNDTLADAVPLTVDATNDVIGTPGDVDYFWFSGTEGQWVVIRATATTLATPKLEPAIILYDSADNAIARQVVADTDVSFLTRIPANGAYYLSVQDRATAQGETPEGGKTYTYNVSVEPMPRGTGYNENSGSGSPPPPGNETVTFRAETNESIATIVGMTSDDASASEVFAFNVVGASMRVGARIATATGDRDNGSTGIPPEIWITMNPGGAGPYPVVAKIDTSMTDYLEPLLPPGSYLLWISDPATAGSNDFFAVELTKYVGALLMENDDNANGTIAGAQVFGQPTSISFSGRFDSPGDFDHYKFAATTGQVLSFDCGSYSLGSGVQAFHADLFASTDTTGTTILGSGSEGPTQATSLLFEYTAPSTGEYVIRLSRNGQVSGVIGAWYTCSMTIR